MDLAEVEVDRSHGEVEVAEDDEAVVQEEEQPADHLYVPVEVVLEWDQCEDQKYVHKLQ